VTEPGADRVNDSRLGFSGGAANGPHQIRFVSGIQARHSNLQRYLARIFSSPFDPGESFSYGTLFSGAFAV
jgi:hypothetical protein